MRCNHAEIFWWLNIWKFECVFETTRSDMKENVKKINGSFYLLSDFCLFLMWVRCKLMEVITIQIREHEK